MTTTAFYTQHELTAQEIRADEVRNAAVARNQAKASSKPFKFKDPTAPANDAQKRKIWALLKELYGVDRQKYTEAASWINDNIDNPIVFTMEMASKTIDRLRLRIEEAVLLDRMNTPPVTSAPYVRTPRDAFADVPDGYYAVFTEAETLAFYRVSTWKKSGDRKVQVKASDALHPIKGHKAADAILAKIREITAVTAGRLFARELKQCYRCGRDLTDEESRGNGLGPVCINKV